MAQPKCPDCGAVGMDQIVSEESKQQSRGGDAWFDVVYCEHCGHIYGVFAKHVSSHVAPPPIPRISPFQ